jgi:hypothetical protein
VICYAFSVPASAFVSQVNRATSETLRLQATQEGLAPLKAWIKSALDHVIQVCLGETDLEFAWVGDDGVDPLQQAQTLNILVAAGIKTIAEARADLGLAAEAKAASALGKFNPYHDEDGRFTTAGDAFEPAVGGAKPQQDVQIAANDERSAAASTRDAAIAALSHRDRDRRSAVTTAQLNRAQCIAICSKIALPTNDFGIQFQRRMLACESGGNSGFPEWDKHFR